MTVYYSVEALINVLSRTYVFGTRNERSFAMDSVNLSDALADSLGRACAVIWPIGKIRSTN